MELEKNVKVPAWRLEDTLPTHNGIGWAVWRRHPILCVGIDEVTLQLKGWNPLQPLLIGAPGASRFVPPPAIAELKGTIQAFQTRTFYGIIAFCLGSCLFFTLSLEIPGRRLAPIYSIALLVTFIMAIDYWFFLRHAVPLIERSQFFYWLQASKEGRTGFAVWMLAGIGIGLFQLVMQQHSQNFDSMIENRGLMFRPALAGEVWRFFVGPFFHSGIGHYLNNAFSLLFVGSVAWALFGYVSLFVFFGATWLSAIGQTLFGSSSFDSYLGISGGVFALYGLIIAAGLIDRKFLPQGFSYLCVGIVAVTGAGGALLSANTASVAHGLGFVIGILHAPFLLRRAKR